MNLNIFAIIMVIAFPVLFVLFLMICPDGPSLKDTRGWGAFYGLLHPYAEKHKSIKVLGAASGIVSVICLVLIFWFPLALANSSDIETLYQHNVSSINDSVNSVAVTLDNGEVQYIGRKNVITKIQTVAQEDVPQNTAVYKKVRTRWWLFYKDEYEVTVTNYVKEG